MSDIRTFNVTVSKKTRKKKQKGGDEIRGVSPIINAVKGIEAPSSAAVTDPSTWLTYPSTMKPVNILHPPNPSLKIGGAKDTKHIRVELKKREIPKRVHLNQKKDPKIKKHTKKVRKITIGISTLHKRITRAKKLHKSVKDLPLDKLKEKLIKDGLIKATSKAPESVLRQILSDSEVVHKRAL